VGQVAC